MRTVFGIMLAAGFLSAAPGTCRPQTATSAPVAAPANGSISGQQALSVPGDIRAEKQRALAKQAEKLFDMATELKVQVDKTNKNILSLEVVAKAEQIEMLAKGMKEQARK